MSSFSGLSAILTVSLVALLTVQMLKDKFEMVENYGEKDDNGHNMNMDYLLTEWLIRMDLSACLDFFFCGGGGCSN